MTNTKRPRKASQTSVVSDGEEERIMPILPHDIIVDILSMLPGKSLCRFKCVCRYWYHKLFKDPLFNNSRLKHREKVKCFSVKDQNSHEFYMHGTNSSLLLSDLEDDNYERVKIDSPFRTQLAYHTNLEIEILGSCNGLILMRNKQNHHREDRLFLGNPLTKEIREIGIPEIKYGQGYFKKINCLINISYGFGYDWHTDDYKIVKSTCYGSDIRRIYGGCEVQVYTSSSHSWKTLPNIPYRINGFRNKTEVVFVSGAFHWIAMNLETYQKCILSFDIHEQNFREVAFIQQVNKNYSYGMPLCVLQGCLCMILLCNISSKIEVWMIEDYKVKEPWTKLFTAQLPALLALSMEYVEVLWEFRNGEVLFVTTAGYGRNTCFVIYDLVSNKTKVIKNIQHFPGDGKWNIVAYVESLVSLSSIGWSHKRPRTYSQGSRKSIRLANKDQLIGR